MASLAFKILIAIDAIATAVIGYFFLAGLADGSVSAFNIGLWTGILAAISLVLIAGVLLYRSGRKVPGNLVLAILALPTALYGAFLLLIIVTQPSWQ